MAAERYDDLKIEEVSLGWCDRYDHNVLEVCSDLHRSCSGTGDRLEYTAALIFYAFLKARLGDWTPSACVASLRFDEAVKMLAKATVLEYEESGHLKNDLEYVRNQPPDDVEPGE